MSRIEFSRRKEIIEKRIKVEPISKMELSELIKKHKPKEIWHSGWSNSTPFFIITEYVSGGFMAYCNAWDDKTPQKFHANRLYLKLKYQGFEQCYFTITNAINKAI